MAPIEKLAAKHSPAILVPVLEPLVTIVIMILLAYCVLGPIGFVPLHLPAILCCGCTTLGFVGVALFAAVMPLSS